MSMVSKNDTPHTNNMLTRCFASTDPIYKDNATCVAELQTDYVNTIVTRSINHKFFCS